MRNRCFEIQAPSQLNEHELLSWPRGGPEEDRRREGLYKSCFNGLGIDSRRPPSPWGCVRWFRTRRDARRRLAAAVLGCGFCTQTALICLCLHTAPRCSLLTAARLSAILLLCYITYELNITYICTYNIRD